MSMTKTKNFFSCYFGYCSGCGCSGCDCVSLVEVLMLLVGSLVIVLVVAIVVVVPLWLFEHNLSLISEWVYADPW